MFFQAGGNGKNVGIENDILRIEAKLFGQDFIRPVRNLHFAFLGIGLSFFIKSHHDHRGAKAFTDDGLLDEFFFSFFHGNGIDDTFSLHTFQTGFNDTEFGRIDHDRNLRNIGLALDQVQEMWSWLSRHPAKHRPY